VTALQSAPDGERPPGPGRSGHGSSGHLGWVHLGSRLSLGRRLAFIFAVGAVLAVISLGLAGWSFGRQVEARNRVVNRLDPTVLQVQILLNAYIDEETAVRGFALTHQEDFLQPYTAGIASQRAARHQLAGLLAHEPASARLLAVVEQRASVWTNQFALPAVAAVRAGHGATYSSTAVLNTEKHQFDSIRRAVANLEVVLRQARTSTVIRLHHAATVFESTISAAVVLLLLAGLGAYLALRVWVTTPLSELGDNVRLVAAGDLQHRIEPAGPPELRALGADADAMRGRIVDELRAVEEARARLQESNADLARTNAELGRSNVELEQFAYVASHDLQEPLRKVASFCQLLQRRYQGRLDDQADEYIAFAVDGANRMQTLINDLLAFSRVGRTTARFVAVDLQVAFRQAVRNLDTAITESGARVTADPLPTVLGDASLLVALLQNLIGNAVKFRADRPPVVHVGCVTEAARWCFDITDNGVGIEPRFADRVFVIFQRLHTKDAYPGTGIGLALCKKIVEFHGGEIWIDTERVEGARICWTLPKTGTAPNP
jgi:signal transduction histidine kinase